MNPRNDTIRKTLVRESIVGRLLIGTWLLAMVAGVTQLAAAQPSPEPTPVSPQTGVSAELQVSFSTPGQSASAVPTSVPSTNGAGDGQRISFSTPAAMSVTVPTSLPARVDSASQPRVSFSTPSPITVTAPNSARPIGASADGQPISFSTPQVPGSTPHQAVENLHRWPRQQVAFSSPRESPRQVDSGVTRLLEATQPLPLTEGEEIDPIIDRDLREDQRIGKEPEQTNDNLQFLRSDSILLEPGQWQFEITAQYLVDESDFALAQVQGNLLVVDEARRRQRLFTTPLEFRLGLTPNSQVFVNVPFGWINSEVDFNAVDEFQNDGGIGDVSAGITFQLREECGCQPTILGTLAFSAPTGKSSLATSLAVPQSSLGEGFWTITTALTAIHTFDPVVVFYGLGYRHRFESTIDGFGVNPGKQAFYRFGTGFAVNPSITFSAEFYGSFIGRDKIDGTPVQGSLREPINMRLATTIVRCGKPKRDGTVKTVEPFVNFGLTEEAVDTLFGISWTH